MKYVIYSKYEDGEWEFCDDANDEAELAELLKEHKLSTRGKSVRYKVEVEK